MDPRRVIIDTDPGIDDSAAIFFALRSPELRVECLTTVYGNAPIGHTSQNAIRILEAAGWAELPIYVGAGRPLVRERPRPGARPKLGPKAQAFVVALACTKPPAGRHRWTMQLLADRVVALQLVPDISDEATSRNCGVGAEGPAFHPTEQWMLVTTGS